MRLAMQHNTALTRHPEAELGLPGDVMIIIRIQSRGKGVTWGRSPVLTCGHFGEVLQGRYLGTEPSINR